MKRWALMLILVGLGRGATGAPVPEVQVTPLVDGVWVHTSWQTIEQWGRVASNGLILREGNAVVVVDTAWGAAPSRVLLDWIERELGLPVNRLIVTHFHADRIGGWEVFAERGARIVASSRTLELAKVKPTEAFDLVDPQLGKPIASGALEILYPGPGHTEDNVVVWGSQSKVLAGGCAVRSAESRGLGNVADATISAWASAMRRVQKQYPEIKYVVPGHGAAGGAELIQHTIDLAKAAQ